MNKILERLASLGPEERAKAAKLLEVEPSELAQMIAGKASKRHPPMPAELQGMVNALNTSLASIAANVPHGFEVVISPQGVSYRKRPGRRPAGMPSGEELLESGEEQEVQESEAPVTSQYPPKPRGTRGRNR